MTEKKPILIAGAGIAGLTAALSLSRRGFDVSVVERAPVLEAFGAGLQLAPNATRVLQTLGVLERLADDAVQPEALRLADAASGKLLAEMPLGKAAEMRWHAPYLTAHRADLQRALLGTVKSTDNITVGFGADVADAEFFGDGVTLRVQRGRMQQALAGSLLIGADGVWSSLRALVRDRPESRFSGHVAWRTTLHLPAGSLPEALRRNDVITAFLSPHFHLVAYPISAGKALNLVAVTRGNSMERHFDNTADVAALDASFSGTVLSELAEVTGSWTAWPLHEVAHDAAWYNRRGLVLIGDAAHAMTPFAAQGAAMAIEDGFALAKCLGESGSDAAGAFKRFEAERKPRISRVARRGAFNKFTWNAAGPVAMVRNLALSTRSPEKLMADFDWLYGFEA